MYCMYRMGVALLLVAYGIFAKVLESATTRSVRDRNCTPVVWNWISLAGKHAFLHFAMVIG